MHGRLPQTCGSCGRNPGSKNAGHDGHGIAVGEEMKGKEYIRPIPRNWWLTKRSYTLFMIRELTAVFVGGYAIFLLFLIYRASQGPEAFNAFVDGLKSPFSIILHI